MRSGAAVVYAPEYRCDIGAHVFPMRKFAMILERLIGAGELAAADIVAPGPATRDELRLVHTEEYLDDLERLRWTPRTMMSELPLTGEIVRAYAYAAGGTLRAARAALEAGMGVNVGGGFHHAFADHAEGFCYINDLAVAVRVLQRDRSVRRAAIADLDVHQGNGTARIFRDDPDVFTLSVHQEANYPVKERGDLDDGIEDADYLARVAGALERVWAFGPDLLLYQAGADPYLEDMLGGLSVSKAGLEARDRLVLEGCARRGIPAVVTLGGGYARRVEDTVAIHATTCAIAMRLARPASR